MKDDNSWLDRALTVCFWHYTLILSEAEFFAELTRLGSKYAPCNGWLGGAHARVHWVHGDQNETGNDCALVCIDRELSKQKTGIQVAALLFHEAVHIWQGHARSIGSFNDHGDEEEAYAIQNIGQSLLEEYARRMIQTGE